MPKLKHAKFEQKFFKYGNTFEMNFLLSKIYLNE